MMIKLKVFGKVSHNVAVFFTSFFLETFLAIYMGNKLFRRKHKKYEANKLLLSYFGWLRANPEPNIGFLLSCSTVLSYCSDFRYESNGIFVLGVGFFFFRQISTF